MENNENIKKYNQIPYRLNVIENMVGGKIIDSMINFNKDKDIIKINDTDTDIRNIMPKKYIDFNKAIKDLGGKLLYIKSGSTGHTFKGIYPANNKEKPNYAVKIVAYPRKENYGDMFHIKRPENAELLMIKVLSEFIISKQTPHIVLPITTFNTSIKPFINLPKENIVNNKKFDTFIKKYKKKEYYDNVSVLISEWANSGDLIDYIKKNHNELKTKHWRAIFFQLLSVLAVIQTKYPGFRHNDLKANNILVHKIPIAKNNNKFKYKINNQTYIVPNIGFQIKLWDFDFACIPGVVDNTKVEAEWTNRLNVKSEKHQYYDVHYFFNTFTRKGFFPEFWKSENISCKVKEFVKRVIPEHLTTGNKKVTEKGRLLINNEYLTPDQIIKEDPFFKMMRVD